MGVLSLHRDVNGVRVMKIISNVIMASAFLGLAI
jgi:hypothetical protein